MTAASEFARFTAVVQQLCTKLAERKSQGGDRVKFPGICADAVALGVSRIHLWLVLTGARRSLTLTSRYQALKRSGGRARLKSTQGKAAR